MGRKIHQLEVHVRNHTLEVVMGPKYIYKGYGKIHLLPIDFKLEAHET